jgi:hypothetical protein
MTEFTPPAAGELVCFEKQLRDLFDPPLCGTVFRFERVARSESTGRTEWLLYDELNNMNIACSNLNNAWSFIRKATISEKDAHSRRLDPTARRRDANLARTFSP